MWNTHTHTHTRTDWQTWRTVLVNWKYFETRNKMIWLILLDLQSAQHLRRSVLFACSECRQKLLWKHNYSLQIVSGWGGRVSHPSPHTASCAASLGHQLPAQTPLLLPDTYMYTASWLCLQWKHKSSSQKDLKDKTLHRWCKQDRWIW